MRTAHCSLVDHWIASPRIGTKYALTENLVWRATLSTGFRAPAVFDEDLHIAQVGGEGFLLENSPDLKEEKSVSFGSGMQYPGAAGGRRYQAGFDFFYTDLRNAFTLVEEENAGRDFRRHEFRREPPDQRSFRCPGRIHRAAGALGQTR